LILFNGNSSMNFSTLSLATLVRQNLFFRK
jgi:hypothetical protein